MKDKYGYPIPKDVLSAIDTVRSAGAPPTDEAIAIMGRASRGEISIEEGTSLVLLNALNNRKRSSTS